MKFKYSIGDEVISKHGYSFDGEPCVITRTSGSCGLYFIKPCSSNLKNEYAVPEDNITLINSSRNNKIVITSDGTTTLARLYDDSKVIKSAEAKCSPDDTYDFATGANLAYDRLMRPTAKHVQDKPKYKVGDKAKIINNNSSHGFNLGEIVKIHSNPRKLSLDWCWVCTQEDGKERFNPHVYECDIEPYTEPAKEPAEPVKLYCVKDYKPGEWLTNGKIYTFSDGIIKDFDNRFISINPKSWEEYKTANSRITDCLVPLVKRPAKVGEWICISKSHSERFIGTIGKVIDFVDKQPKINHNRVWFSSNPDGTENTVLSVRTEYLVLDGYQPEEPAKEEPKYYSGKVICVVSGKEGLTKGKVYEVKNGYLIDDVKHQRPQMFDAQKSIDDDFLCDWFIEYKGEQA